MSISYSIQPFQYGIYFKCDTFLDQLASHHIIYASVTLPLRFDEAHGSLRLDYINDVLEEVYLKDEKTDDEIFIWGRGSEKEPITNSLKIINI